MVSRLATMMTLAGVLLAAPIASAFTLGETAAATGVQGTLAGSGSTSAAGTIGTVKRSLGAASATKQGQLEGAGVAIGWGGKGGGPGGWATAAAGGWATRAQGGWATASTGWATAASGGAWASGGWGGGAGR
jgi:hypothetical protein